MPSSTATSCASRCCSKPCRRRCDARWRSLSLAIGSAAVAYLAWWACKFTYESFEIGEPAQGLLPIPIWIPQTSFALGSLLLLIALIDELVIVARGGVPTFVRLVHERHAKGDFSHDL